MLRMTIFCVFATLSHVTPKTKGRIKTSGTISYEKDNNKIDNFNDKGYSVFNRELNAIEGNSSLKNSASELVSYTVNPYFQMLAPENINNFDREGTDSNALLETVSLLGANKDRRISKRLYVHHTESDDRYLVTGYQRRLFPYSNVVRLSTGCTGTLLTPSHVLTAAHCVHDGKDFKQNVEMLKIEVLDKIGYRLHYITSIKISTKWIKSQKLPEAARGAYDYSILHLNLPVRRRARFMKLAVPDLNKLGSNVHFFGFFSTATSGMWKSTCATDDSLVIMRKNVILAECDSSTGNSGAAVFTENVRDGQMIIGVLSNLISASSNEEETEYSSIMLLTLSKALDICAMIYPEAEEYNICAAVKRLNVENLSGPKRIVPFFGK